MAWFYVAMAYFGFNALILILSAVINYPFDLPIKKTDFVVSVVVTLLFGVLMVILAAIVVFVGTLLRWFDDNEQGF